MLDLLLMLVPCNACKKWLAIKVLYVNGVWLAESKSSLIFFYTDTNNGSFKGLMPMKPIKLALSASWPIPRNKLWKRHSKLLVWLQANPQLLYLAQSKLQLSFIRMFIHIGYSKTGTCSTTLVIIRLLKVSNTLSLGHLPCWTLKISHCLSKHLWKRSLPSSPNCKHSLHQTN